MLLQVDKLIGDRQMSQYKYFITLRCLTQVNS